MVLCSSNIYAQLTQYELVKCDNNIITKTIEVTKQVGVILAESGVNNSAAANYHIPIIIPKSYTDHLGSITTVTDKAANIITEQNFDTWGKARNASNWTNTTPTAVPTWLYRGYTGHEQVPEFALINMNGRMHDPALGRMCSPDKFIQNRYFTQAYNRYSYCWNNPMKYTDPSGDFLSALMFSTNQGYDIQKFISPIAINLSFGIGTHKNGIGYDYSYGVPQSAPASVRWHRGYSYHKNNYFMSGFESRKGRELSTVFLSISNTEYSSLFGDDKFDQNTTTFKIGSPMFNVSHENDIYIGGISKMTFGFIPSSGGDRYRTASLRATVGLHTFNSNLFTGDPGLNEDQKTDIDGIYSNQNGNTPDEYRAGTYEVGFAFFHIGVDYEGIRHVIQNRFSHDFLTNKGVWNPDIRKRAWPKRKSGSSKWFKVMNTKPKLYFQFESSGGTQW